MKNLSILPVLLPSPDCNWQNAGTITIKNTAPVAINEINLNHDLRPSLNASRAEMKIQKMIEIRLVFILWPISLSLAVFVPKKVQKRVKNGLLP